MTGLKSVESVASSSLVKPLRETSVFLHNKGRRFLKMRGILLWVLGIPIPVIILLYLFHVI
jgi:hypothetical protein